MNRPLLVLNAGSSSIKFSVFDDAQTRIANGQVDGVGGAARLAVDAAMAEPAIDQALPDALFDTALRAIHDWCQARFGHETGFAAIGHRVVHGGEHFVDPLRIDDRVVSALQALTPLAPLHQPSAVAAMRAMQRFAPQVAQIACFDTAFHSRQPPLARAFGLPREITAKGIRRFGFHGLSCEYIVAALPDVAPELCDKKIIIAHLGSGASLCAIDAGRSVASTMGLGPLDGLLMATRSGALDPSVILYLLREEGMDAQSIEDLLYTRSGLLGVSAISGDMRVLLADASPTAREAVDLFVYRIRRELGSSIAALGGLDGLIFTGGIGEHAAAIRQRVCEDARWFGIDVDGAANQAGRSRISTPASRVSVWIIPADENRVIARHARRVLAMQPTPASTLDPLF